MSGTESRNPASKGIDLKPIEVILQLINQEDSSIPAIVEKQIPNIAKSVRASINTIRRGGCVYFLGAGTSGRLGVLEAAELPPTFGVSTELFKAVIAGGRGAIFKSIEKAEDSEIDGQNSLQSHRLGQNDLVIGVSSSGTTPFVLGGIRYAQNVGASTIGIISNSDSPLSKIVDIPIIIETGSEIVAGSTRMKAGTAQKLVLNMITTTSMIKLGRVHDGYMIGLEVTNEKLRKRAKRIISEITKIDLEQAEENLELAGGDTRLAIILTLTDLSTVEAKNLLDEWTQIRSILEDRGINLDS